MKKRAFFVAGGTGGHILPSISLGESFQEEGFNTTYISGTRHLDYKLHQNKDVIHLPARPLVGKDPVDIFNSIFFNTYCFIKALFIFIFDRPDFVLGAGGYICGPTLLGAKTLGIPVFLLEENSVMGLTNKILSHFSDKIFTCFNVTKGLNSKFENKTHILGNPLRKDFINQKRVAPQNDTFTILCFGGSLGAQEINSFVTDFLNNYNGEKVKLIHQVGQNTVDKRENSSIDYHQHEFINDMFQAYMNADLVICRGGASTVAEIRVVQRPTLFIPLRLHADKHQVHNAENLKAEADFPVYVSSGQELQESQLSIFYDILTSQMNLWRSKEPRVYKDEAIDSASLIKKEILNYVQK